MCPGPRPLHFDSPFRQGLRIRTARDDHGRRDSSACEQPTACGSPADRETQYLVRSTRTGVTALVWQYLTDSDNWFLCSEKSQHTLTWHNRKSVTFERDRDSQTKDSLYDVHYRASVAFYDWRGIVGSAP